MNRKKTVWFEVREEESVEDCLKRMMAEGYVASGRKEEPVFAEVEGQIIPVRQLIKFKGTLVQSENA